ncbi:MAG: DUF1343 domain-containing protein [Bacteroidia bacterium]|nr:DUF1343 domain-containing protein [Bacteroidia bacterium]
MPKYIILFFVALSFFGQNRFPQIQDYASIICGADQIHEYLPLLKGRRVGLVTNASGLVGKKHIVDTLRALNINIVKIFSPEHGFRGMADAGEKVGSTVDSITGIPVVSLYGKKKKPEHEDLKGLDIMVFDIQDVGVRFYTYLSTLHYVIEACAEFPKPLIVLDRPNPNGFYIDGPVMKKEFRSFLGLHPVPIVYGMTIGEYANMILGERWVSFVRRTFQMVVIPCKNYDRNKTTRLPVPPSPNLNSFESVLLYPTLGLLEGTKASVGRGTPFPFQCIAHPEYPDTEFCFIPRANAVNKRPLYEGQRCCGINLSQSRYLTQHPKTIMPEWIRQFALRLKKEDFFTKNFEPHAGNAELRKQLVSRISISDIRKTWQKDLEQFKKIRKKYLIYPDFE